ncbi:hypothetical protein GCM10009111_06620 [Colwellia asteriadis]|uniref:Serine aminopeptidase S33 domain-containing protein n=1 Tax=Colwellia asteriadis TaxID=517723 RepID=A0ABN1L3V0_9GAMM
MKLLLITFTLLFLLSGCSVNITKDNFIYQDEKVEVQLDLAAISAKITNDADLTTVSTVSLVTDAGETLKGVQLLHEKARVNIVLFGGSGMKISQSAAILNNFASIPANVMWFDYRGVGVSERKGELNLEDILQDSLQVFDLAKRSLPTNIPMVVHGISMGSIVGSALANERTLDGLVLDGAISSVPELVENTVPAWSKIFSTVTVSPELAQLNNIDFIKQYKNPLLFLAGTEDTITPIAFSQALFDISGSEVKTLATISESKHGMSMKSAAAIKAYTVFIDQITGSGVP